MQFVPQKLQLTDGGGGGGGGGGGHTKGSKCSLSEERASRNIIVEAQL